MARIRSVKPEWLEDEKLAALSDAARVLSLGLILLADDQGRGRANPAFLAGQVWTYRSREGLAKVSSALGKLAEINFVILYTRNGEHYYQIRNWTKHQRVDHPAKPRLPGPDDLDSRDLHEPLVKDFEPLAEEPDTFAPDLRSPITDHRSPTIRAPRQLKVPDADCHSLADYLRAAILRGTPDARLRQSPAEWADTFRLMRDRDHRDPAEVRAVIEWATGDSFWRANILSADKLREKFDTLKGQMRRGRVHPPAGENGLVC